jgi:hypothetical protein
VSLRIEILIEFLRELGGKAGAASARAHPLPEVEMIEVLPGIVEGSFVNAMGGDHDLFQ